MAFDPDTYLNGTATGGFNPDAYLAGNAPIPAESEDFNPLALVGDILAGAAKGASNIGATILNPLDSEARAKRKQEVTEGLRYFGADPDSFAFKGGELASEIAGTAGVGGALAGGAKLLGAAPSVIRALQTGGMTRDVGLATRLGAGATVGGAGMAMIDPDQAAMGAGVGAAMAPALPAAMRGVNALIERGQSFASGAQGQAIEWLRKAFPDNWQEVAARLRDLKPLVPQERPTIAATGDPVLGAIEAQAAGEQSSARALREQHLANREARLATVERGADMLPTVTQTRKEMGDMLYPRAMAETLPVDNTLRTILQGADVERIAGKVWPSMQQGQINALVAGRSVQPTIISGRAAPVTDFAVEGMVPQGGTPEMMQMEALQRLKQAIEGELNAFYNNSRSPLGLSEINARQLETARNQLTGWMQQSPAWQNAREAYARMSPAVSQAQLMQSVQEALQTPTAAEGVAQMNTLMKNLPTAYKRATGVQRFDTPEGVMDALSPLARRRLEGIYGSLQREAEGARNALPQGALPPMGGVLTQIESNVPTWFSPLITAARNILKHVGLNTDEEAARIIHRASTDPQAFARLMQETQPKDRNAMFNVIRQYLQNSPELGAVGQAAGSAGASQ